VDQIFSVLNAGNITTNLETAAIANTVPINSQMSTLAGLGLGEKGVESTIQAIVGWVSGQSVDRTGDWVAGDRPHKARA